MMDYLLCAGLWVIASLCIWWIGRPKFKPTVFKTDAADYSTESLRTHLLNKNWAIIGAPGFYTVVDGKGTVHGVGVRPYDAVYDSLTWREEKRK